MTSEYGDQRRIWRSVLKHIKEAILFDIEAAIGSITGEKKRMGDCDGKIVVYVYDETDEVDKIKR